MPSKEQCLSAQVRRAIAKDTYTYLPDVLIVLVVLGDYPNLISNKINTVETYTELPNKAHIPPIGQSLSEVAGA
jgi:hypothetical protein